MPSAGLLLYRRDSGLEVFLAHPGGPFWLKRDDGAWTIPIGVAEEGEDLLAAACREFQEETGIHPVGPFLSLASIRQKAGKQVHAWAWEGDADRRGSPATPCRPSGPAARGVCSPFPKWTDVPGSIPKLRGARSTRPRPN
ncbi:MAG TPA: NUDIX domain-containing protein [Gemmatimonadales bacterium]|nr:NUDIX domain-containing protein [Gemmatimonadales bacterium]